MIDVTVKINRIAIKKIVGVYNFYSSSNIYLIDLFPSRYYYYKSFENR